MDMITHTVFQNQNPSTHAASRTMHSNAQSFLRRVVWTLAPRFPARILAEVMVISTRQVHALRLWKRFIKGAFGGNLRTSDCYLTSVPHLLVMVSWCSRNTAYWPLAGLFFFVSPTYTKNV
jgi:hypothetical protein